MSAPLYRIPLKARALLRDRGMSVVKLAGLAKLPVHLVQHALAGHPSATREDRHRIAPWLRMAEHVALGWVWNGDLLPVEQFPKTERPGPAPLPAVETGLEAPEGPGTGGHKPLMQNRAQIPSAPAMGLLPATLSATSTST